LIIDGKPVREAGGSRSDAMRRVYWDVKEFAGKKATLYVQDRSDKPWGHINCDDFRYAAKAEEELLFENSDFEKGDLSNWTADGDAFKAGQPVKGDTVKERSEEKHASNPQGTYWVGSAEPVFAKDAKDEAGSEKPTGTLKSKEFEIKHRVISFRLGGGAGKEDGVYLLVDGKVARWARGNRSDTLHFSTWDVTDLKGKKAVIEIRDKSSGAWGHISADDFRYGRTD
jgi:hypothetical protein